MLESIGDELFRTVVGGNGGGDVTRFVIKGGVVGDEAEVKEVGSCFVFGAVAGVVDDFGSGEGVAFDHGVVVAGGERKVSMGSYLKARVRGLEGERLYRNRSS